MLPGLFPIPPLAGLVALTLTYVVGATGTASVVVPAGAQVGDIAVLLDHARNSGNTNIPTAVVPTNFTTLYNDSTTANSNGFRAIASYKVLEAGDLGATLTGMNDDQVRKFLYILRPSRACTLTLDGYNYQCTAGSPSAQTRAPTASPAVIIGLAHTANNGTFTFSPAGTALNISTDALSQIAVYNTAPSSTTVNVNDTGNWNALTSFALTFA